MSGRHNDLRDRITRISFRHIIQEHPKHVKEEILSNNTYLTHRIGSTTYKIRVHFSDTAGETMEDKILHLIRGESLDNPQKRGIMTMPQMSRQPERSLE